MVRKLKKSYRGVVNKFATGGEFILKAYCKTKYDKYQVALKSCGGTKGETYKTVVDTNIDELFIVIDSLEMFKIPIEVIKNKSTLNLCEKYEKYNVLR